MEYTNALYKYAQGPDGVHAETFANAIDSLLLVTAPMVPHITAELWERRHDRRIHAETWPEADPDKLVVETVTMVIQVNGKVRDRIEVAADVSEEDATQAALGAERVQSWLEQGEVRKVIARPPKLVNIVVS